MHFFDNKEVFQNFIVQKVQILQKYTFIFDL